MNWKAEILGFYTIRAVFMVIRRLRGGIQGADYVLCVFSLLSFNVVCPQFNTQNETLSLTVAPSPGTPEGHFVNTSLHEYPPNFDPAPQYRKLRLAQC